MGYRSDVRIVVSKEGYELLKEFVEYYLKNNVKKEEINEMNLLKSVDIKTEGKDQVYLGWNYLKWYDGYKDVDAIMEGLNYLEDNEHSYRYMIIGEDYTDVEEMSNDGEKDKDNYLEYPSMIRGFDDDYIKELLEPEKQVEENKEEKETIDI